MGKVYNICRVFKIDISAVLTVMSGLDPYMIIELEKYLTCGSLVCVGFFMIFMLKWVGINVYLVIRCLLIKVDQLKC